MKIMLSETVTHFHEIELSDELDIETILEQANTIKNQCDTGYEAVETVLKAYNDRYGEAFEYNVKPNACGTRVEGIEYECTIEE